jgi:uncharacterized protein YjlB
MGQGWVPQWAQDAVVYHHFHQQNGNLKHHFGNVLAILGDPTQVVCLGCHHAWLVTFA